MMFRLLNTAWRLKCQGEAARFRKAITSVEQTQNALLFSMLRDNCNTVFGREHCFASIRSAPEFQQRVPLRTYDEIEPYIQRIAAGETNVLTREPVLSLEPTSGTTSAEKLIPNTSGLRRQFQRGISTWIADLFALRPAVCSGRAYWSISPSLGGPRRTKGGIAIGFDDDAAYLGRFEQWLVRQLLVVPGDVRRLSDIESVRYVTLLHLLSARDLSLISVWSPTFLTSLLEPLREWNDRLVHDLAKGALSIPNSTANHVPPLALSPRPSARRAEEVASLLKSSATDAELYSALWPQLALISCWTDAAAGYLLPSLTRLFPEVEIQSKGLLATEGFVSLPLVGHANALAVRSHFFEFVEQDESGRCRLAHELEVGGKYRVVLTTAGGLYRYELGDEVEVTGFLERCPLLRFVGKCGRISDLVGEKLSEAHVQSSLDRILDELKISPSFMMLTPVLDSPPRYRLYLQGVDESKTPLIARRLQLALEDNPYYRHAIQFKQLDLLEVTLLGRGVSGWSLYEQQCVARGQKVGNIKPAVLDRWTGWQTVFSTHCLQPVKCSTQ